MTQFNVRKPQYVNFWKRLKDIHVDNLERSLRELESGVEQRWALFGEEFDKFTDGYTVEEIADYVDHIYDDIALVRDELPQITRQSMFQTVYGFFEHQMLLLCRAFKADGCGQDIPARGGLQDYRQYLIRNNCIAEENFNQKWDHLVSFVEVRNTFVHYSGYLRDVDEWHCINRWKNKPAY